MRARAILSLGWSILLLAFGFDAWAETIEVSPINDATIYEDVGGDVANGGGDFIFMGRIGTIASPPSTVRRALLRFDLSAIPPNAVIDSVELSLEMNRAPNHPDVAGGTATLHRALADWGEGVNDPSGSEGEGAPATAGDVTWLHRFYDTEFWSAPGGDFDNTASSAVGYGTVEETLVFPSTEDLRGDVGHWVQNPAQNFGWFLIGNEAVDFTARRFDSRENSGAPNPALLTVEYHIPGAGATLGLELVASGLTRPVVVTHAGDGSGRLFIALQSGVIRIYDRDTQTLLPTPFLDISSLVDDSGNEQGLLGLAFHPEFENNRQFYVNYTYDTNPPAGPDRTRIAMYQASAGDPNVADPAEAVILEFEQDFANHNGGDIHFDPEGYLVIASGDGGSGDDPNNRAQSLDTLLGKLLRIDVNSNPVVNGGDIELCGLVQNYAIPPGNPWVGADGGCDEILHYGLRNPWRFSHDAATGDLYIGDVGQDLWEEISFAPAGSVNLNYGWNICEGAHVRGSDTELCAFGELPVIEYSSGPGSGNCSVTGGYVYRGGNTNLQGRYLYADFCSGRIWIATREGDTWTPEEWIETPALGAIATFGQDEQCELYIASHATNSVYRIIDTEILDSSGFEALGCR